MDFPLPDTAYVYRPLKLRPEPMTGWDVYGLQTGLAGIPGFDGFAADGVFGAATEEAVLKFQRNRFDHPDEHDGIAGIGTQRKLASVLARKFRKGWNLPNGIPYGHVESESGCVFGNHTSRYMNGSWDVGLVQRNTAYALEVDGFDAPDSLMRLCEQIANKWEEYREYGEVEPDRALGLACGSWNRPAWTDKLAQV